jgi:DNA-binding NarL/FixJ family response regulator
MILESSELQPTSSAETKPASNSVKVLIADDHQCVLERAVGILQAHFEIVGIATNGKMLVEQASRLQPNIIVSDILMPGFTGLQAAHRLRESGSTAKIIFMSVYETEEFVKACFSEGALGYVTKARMGTDLVLAIHEVMGGRQFISPTVQDCDDALA